MGWAPGLYLRGDVGGAFGTNTTFKNEAGSGIPLLGSTTQTTSIGGTSVLFGGGIGYRFLPMFRADITVDYIPNFIEHGHNSTLTGVSSSGRLNSLVAMANGYLDFNGFWPTALGPWDPYIDAGVGGSRNDLENTHISGTIGPVVLNGNLSGRTHESFAWGAGAGVAYALSPAWSIDVAYKYLDLGSAETGTFVSGPGGSATVQGAKATIKAHTVSLGLRFAFGAPPPPPPVAAPPAPPPAVAAPQRQVFIVFFEFDKSSLTADGRRVVDAAAAAFKSGKSGVAIAGYTDLAGTQQYNLALSKRRADTVKAALVRDGVPAAAIDESWHGKENPRVPTANGVREPQNRRVEITM